MIVIRERNYSGYQPLSGTNYVSSAQIRQNIDDGIYDIADNLENTINEIGEIHPIVNKTTDKLRQRIIGYTTPIKKLVKRKKKNKSKPFKNQTEL